MANMGYCDKHNMVDFLQKPTGSEEFHQISHIRYALTANPTICVSLIEQFWQTTTVEIVNDGKQQITVIVDGHTFAITEASVRRHLQLEDADGLSSLPNTEIFEQLTLIGTYVAPSLTQKLFSNMKIAFSGVHIPLFDTVLLHDQPGQGEGPTLSVESQHTPIASPSTSQPTTSQPISQQEQPSQVPTTEPITSTSSPPLHEPSIPQTTSSMPHDSPLPGGYTPRSVEGSMKLNDLTELCTKLFDKVTNLENDLTQTKKVHGKALTKLVKKVKHLEAKLKSTTARRKARMIILDDEEELVSEDPSKQGRITETEHEDVETVYADVEYKLDQTKILQQITPTKVPQSEDQRQESSDAQLSVLSAAKFLAGASRERAKTYTRRRRSIDSSRVSTVGGLFSTAEEVHDQDEEIAHKLNKKEIAKAAAREEQERIDFEKALELQKYKEEYDDLSEEYGWIPDGLKRQRQRELQKRHYFKKLRTTEASRSDAIQEQPTEEPKDLSEEDLKKMLEIVLVGNITEAYQSFEDMLKGFDREDLVTLWTLVKERFRSAQPTEDMEKALWVELRRLFEPNKDDMLRKLQRYMHAPLTWRLYGSSAVHHASSIRGHDIYMLTEKDYPLSIAVMRLMLSRRLQVEEDSEMARNLIMKIFIESQQAKKMKCLKESSQNQKALIQET
ncbi:hypothetical protein Tco_0598089 [Tanacetum coccineum]